MLVVGVWIKYRALRDSNSQTPLIKTLIFWDFVLGLISSRRAIPLTLHGVCRRMADFRHLILCWQIQQVTGRRRCLEKQVEREGIMDWITLLIPVKLAVICLILWVSYKYYIGAWSSEAPGRSTCPDAAYAAAAGPSPGSNPVPSFQVIHKIVEWRVEMRLVWWYNDYIIG